jgi:glucokinase-like ROK family protein
MQRKIRTGDQFLIREINLSVIMNRLREHAPISRASLAEMTGLNKSTVSSLVNELIRHHFIREVGIISSGTGRPSILLELNPKAGYIVSCEIGGDFISVLCANFAGQIIWRRHEGTRAGMDQQAALDLTVSLMREAVEVGLSSCADCGPLLGIAVGVPGLIDRTTGTLLTAPNLGWDNFSLRSLLGQAFPGVPIFVNNEANMAALGEYFFGSAQGYDEILYISAGVGLGGAYIRHGQILKGSSGFASEFGHLTMDPDGEVCSCGNRGCWETQVSQRALFRIIRQALDQNLSTSLLQMAGRDLNALTVPMIVNAANAGDPVACAALEEIGRYLGIGIASLINAFNPDLVLLGGVLSFAGAYLLPSIEIEVNRRALRRTAEAARMALADHRFDACVMGGVAVVYQSILIQPGQITRLTI